MPRRPAPEIIRAELIGAATAVALRITARSSIPLLLLCRLLIEAGHDPGLPLHAYRGKVLALTVRSIGQAARLRIGSHGVGFEPASACGTGPPMRPSAQGLPDDRRRRRIERIKAQRALTRAMRARGDNGGGGPRPHVIFEIGDH